MVTREKGSHIQELLEMDPYSLKREEKEGVFIHSMKDAIIHHIENCIEFSQVCKNSSFNPNSNFQLEDIPFLPVTIFKKFNLKSIPDTEIFKTIYSSATTSGKPSIIYLDRITSQRQTRALVSIISDFIKEKMDYVILDTKDIITQGQEIKSRASAIRGFLPFMKSINFVLDSNLKLDVNKLEKIAKAEQVCIFGFTWLIYKIVSENKNNKKVYDLFKTFGDPIIMHIGGWKKLTDLNISKDEFYELASEFFGIQKRKIVDIYGMTEQLGTIYPDCEYGNKHVPVYSEILIRNPTTLKTEDVGKIGLIQLLSPLPNSYPGISILSDDLGHLEGIDDCPCGRKGKYFRFDKRSEIAEVKGCGDTLG